MSIIVSDELEEDKFQALKFKMTNFLMRKRAWPFINRDEEEPILATTSIAMDFKDI